MLIVKASETKKKEGKKKKELTPDQYSEECIDEEGRCPKAIVCCKAEMCSHEVLTNCTGLEAIFP